MQIVQLVQKSKTRGSSFVRLWETIVDFGGESKDLLTKFSAIYLQTFKTRKQHFRSVYNQVLGYGPAYASRCKQSDLELESVRLRIIIEADLKLR